MAIVNAQKTPARAAPISETTIVGWLIKNLFSSPLNTVLTFFMLFIIYLTVSGVFVWGYLDELLSLKTGANAMITA